MFQIENPCLKKKLQLKIDKYNRGLGNIRLSLYRIRYLDLD